MRSYLIILLLFASWAAFAQVFPLQVTTHISPPYTPYLSDYTAPGAQKLMLQLRANDPRLTDYRVKLRITIEGVNITIRTKPTFIPQQPIVIEGGGVPQLFYGEDLAEYFNPNALDFSGISRSQYEKGAKLPEGLYRFTIEALDYNRNALVSNRGSGMAWVILNDPPLLNLPRKDSKVRIIDPTTIAFTWTPRHSGSPNAAFSSEYVFKLVEVWPANRNPYDAFLSQPTLYETITSQTQIIYGLSEPALIPGRKYAWQVQARDIDGKDLFKNGGKSEVFVFQFGDALGVPENINFDGANASTINLSWDPPSQGEMPREYHIRYRRKGTGDSGSWYEASTANRWITLSSLQPDMQYEIQVRSEAKPQVGEYSLTKVMATAEISSAPYTCGKEAVVSTSQNTTPLLALAKGDVLTCNNFRVLVTEVNGTGGTFSGKGIMSVPFFNSANIQVSFASIRVNNDYEIILGNVVSVYNPGSEMGRIVEEAHKIGEQEDQHQPPDSTTQEVKPEITYTVPGTIDSVWVNDQGEVVVLDEEGNEATHQRPVDPTTKERKVVAVSDSAGNTYVVQQDPATGKTTVTKLQGGGLNAGSNTNATVQADPVKDRIIVLILEQFEEEIAAWLRINGKGGEEDLDVFLAEEMPQCFPRNANILVHISESTISYFKQHPAELREKIESNQTNKLLFDKIGKLFSDADAIAWSKVPQEDGEAAKNVACSAIVEADIDILESEFKARVGTSAKVDCLMQGWQRGKELYGEYDAGVAIYAGFIKFLICQTEKENCGSGSLSSFSCGITNGLLQELDWVVFLEGDGITKEDIVKLILCVKDSYPIGGRVEDNPDLYKILFKCITGVELGDLGNSVKEFIIKNWDESYYQGQATAFVITLISPFKGKIVNKLRTLPEYASRITKIEALSRATKAGELVEFSKTLSRYGDEAADITTTLIKTGDDFTVLSNARKLPGTAGGNGKAITGAWLRGTERNAGLFPKTVADKLKGRQFKNFDEFRQTFWKEVANDPALATQFDPQSIQRMKNGFAPFTDVTQQLGGQKNYILHHKVPINQGGAVYDMDNLYIVTPQYHKEILDPAFHYGYGY